MIPFFARQPLLLHCDNGDAVSLDTLGIDPASGQLSCDPHRIYLTVPEHYEQIQGLFAGQGLAAPSQLKQDILSALADPPRPLSELSHVSAAHGRLRICVLYGGGGIGDTILLAPALRLLAAELFKESQDSEAPQIDLFAAFPKKTEISVGAVQGLTVHPLPLSLGRFAGYDVFVDFSGMASSDDFGRTHTTDFALLRMGLAPESFADAEKRPALDVCPQAAAVVNPCLEAARLQAGGKPLIAVATQASTLSRTLPPEQTVLLCRAILAQGGMPVMLHPDKAAAERMIAQWNLQKKMIDLSSSSEDLPAFIALLAGMDGIVSVDTAAVHIGAALGTPTVALFNCIEPRLRVAYSPGVEPVSIVYSGKFCKTPCGISKSRAYVQGSLANGKFVRMEFDYACDEAVDRQALLGAAMQRLQAAKAQEVGTVAEEVCRETGEAFGCAVAPCWRNFSAPEVAARILAKTAGCSIVGP